MVSFSSWHDGCSLSRHEIFSTWREPNWRITMKKLVLMMTLGVIFLDAGAAFATATPPRPIPNPGTLVLFTTGIAGLAWWLRKRD